jgi:anti-sigma-K factor RskA
LNIEEYISSGILEAYALGELTAAERREVERNLSIYPELKTEFSRIEEVQEVFLMKAAVQPHASVKENLFRKIDERKPTGKIVSMPATNSQLNVWKYAAAASVAIALVSTFLAYTYYNKWRNTENNLSELIAQNQQMAQDYNTVNQRLDKIESDIEIINNPSFAKVIMKGTENAPEALASVYWNASTKEVYLSIQNMKTLSQESQYQLWAIVDGKPVDAGVFDINSRGLLKMKDLAGAAAFAVTIEPRGGKPTPSLETMQVIGNVIRG